MFNNSESEKLSARKKVVGIVKATNITKFKMSANIWAISHTTILSILIRVVPESPRWLLAKRRTTTAVDVLCKIADTNGGKVSQEEVTSAVGAIMDNYEESENVTLDTKVTDTEWSNLQH